MSKHNYSQYSNNKTPKHNPVEASSIEEAKVAETIEEVDVAAPTPEVELVEETVETVSLPEIVTGVVVKCAKLNVRAEACATADVVCVLTAASEIAVDPAGSTNEWVKVCTATGIDGYCMRKFIDVNL